MSNTHPTRKSSYSHLSATERGEIVAYLKTGKKPIEIARLLGRHRSTICREIKRGSVDQVQDKNGKRTYFNAYFADGGQGVYETNRQKCSYLKLNDCSARFIEQLGDALKANIRLHSDESEDFR